MNVISLAEAREARMPHLAGKTRCLGCGHEAVGVSPAGTFSGMECTQCHLNKVVYVNLCAPENEFWRCICGNDLFFLKPTGALCTCCGLTTTDYLK